MTVAGSGRSYTEPQHKGTGTLSALVMLVAGTVARPKMACYWHGSQRMASNEQVPAGGWSRLLVVSGASTLH